MFLFLPILVGWATWQIVAMAAGAGLSLIALVEIVRRLNNRRHMNNMIESYLESGEIGVEEYILATGLAKSDRHAQLVFKLMLPMIQKHAAEARARKAHAAREAALDAAAAVPPPVAVPVVTPVPKVEAG
jgi:hypothetical protein